MDVQLYISTDFLKNQWVKWTDKCRIVSSKPEKSLKETWSHESVELNHSIQFEMFRGEQLDTLVQLNIW